MNKKAATIIGAVAGDIIGSVYEWNNVKTTDFPLFSDRSDFTDDTVLTMAVADCILNNKDYAETIWEYGRKYRGRGYGGRFRETCQGSVPQAIAAFLESTDYENAVRLAVSIGGDSDTIACITGGIAAAFYREIPEEIVEFVYSRLSNEFIEILHKFDENTSGASGKISVQRPSVGAHEFTCAYPSPLEKMQKHFSAGFAFNSDRLIVFFVIQFNLFSCISERFRFADEYVDVPGIPAE